jgi:hypothetical protein
MPVVMADYNRRDRRLYTLAAAQLGWIGKGIVSGFVNPLP